MFFVLQSKKSELHKSDMLYFNGSLKQFLGKPIEAILKTRNVHSKIERIKLL